MDVIERAAPVHDRRSWERREIARRLHAYFVNVTASKAGQRASGAEVCRYLRAADDAQVFDTP
jgi:hypothetical protein